MGLGIVADTGAVVEFDQLGQCVSRRREGVGADAEEGDGACQLTVRCQYDGLFAEAGRRPGAGLAGAHGEPAERRGFRAAVFIVRISIANGAQTRLKIDRSHCAEADELGKVGRYILLHFHFA